MACDSLSQATTNAIVLNLIIQNPSFSSVRVTDQDPGILERGVVLVDYT